MTTGPHDRAQGSDQHPIVEKLVSDPASPEPVTILTGYRGASSEPGRIRIYLRPDLKDWVELDPADVRHEEHAAPTAPSRFWVRDAALLHATSHAATTPGALLRGRIVDTQFDNAASYQGRAAAHAAWPTHDANCGHSFDHCASTSMAGCSFQNWCC